MKDKIQFLAHKGILFSNAPNTGNKKIIFFLFSVLHTIDIVTSYSIQSNLYVLRCITNFNVKNKRFTNKFLDK